MTTIELGVTSTPMPGRAVPAAMAAEQDGYDVLLMPDSQNLLGEPFTQLALAAAATETIKLGTGVTNPITRHPATTAASILAIQYESSGPRDPGHWSRRFRAGTHRAGVSSADGGVRALHASGAGLPGGRRG